MKISALAVTASLALALDLACVTGCNKLPEPIPRTEPTAEPKAAAADSARTPAMPPGHPAVGNAAPPGQGAAATSPGAAAGPEDVTYDAPAAWTSVPNPSPMRKATFKIPKAGGDAEDAELAVSSAGGGLDANVKRWEGQFGPEAKAKTEQRTVNGLKVTMVEIKGKISGAGMMGMPSTAAKDNQMLLGAIVDGGDRQHFFKLVGGDKTVTAAKKDFDKLVASLRAK
jgi:hypothetical protein